MATVTAPQQQINEAIDKFEDWAQPDEDDWMTVVLVSLRSALLRAYDVFEFNTTWAAANQTLLVYGTLFNNAAPKLSPEVALKFGRLLEVLRAIVDA